MRRALDLIYTCSCAASPRKGTKGKPRTVSLCRCEDCRTQGDGKPSSPSTVRNLNITKSTHGAQNADLSNAPEIESRPLWR